MKDQPDIFDSELENKIYNLRGLNLPDAISKAISEADIAYLQNRNNDAWQLVNKIEKEIGI